MSAVTRVGDRPNEDRLAGTELEDSFPGKIIYQRGVVLEKNIHLLNLPNEENRGFSFFLDESKKTTFLYFFLEKTVIYCVMHSQISKKKTQQQ